MKELKIMKWQWIMAFIVAIGPTFLVYALMEWRTTEGIPWTKESVFFLIGLTLTLLSSLIVSELKLWIRKKSWMTPLDWKFNFDRTLSEGWLILYVIIAGFTFYWQSTWLSIVGAILVNAFFSKWLSFPFVNIENRRNTTVLKKKKKKRKKRKKTTRKK